MIEAVLGGMVIGLAAVTLMLSRGRIAGISGIVATALKRPWPSWAMLFVVGLLIGRGVSTFALGSSIERDWAAVSPLLLIGGVLVGFGTRLGSGCTSGHGVCGIARFSKRSIVATVTFLLVAIATATGVHA